jgi:glucose/arabinose dehydrogenase
VDDNDRTYWTVSRFTWLPGSGTIDPNSEFILMSQYDPHRYHNGGATFFGNDGFLYITVGDGGDGGDSLDNSQKINLGLFGGILRIDVDNDPVKSHPIRRQPTENPLWIMNPKPAGWPVSYSQGYGIPKDNP